MKERDTEEKAQDQNCKKESSITKSLKSIANSRLIDKIIVYSVAVFSIIVIASVVIFVVVTSNERQPFTVLTFPFPHNSIRYDSEDVKSYNSYMFGMTKYINDYKDEQSFDKSAVNCSTGHCARGSRVCSFDFTQFPKECTAVDNFGFVKSQPCLLLRLKPHKHWDPDNYIETDVPKSIRSRWSPHYIGIHCHGQTLIDEEALGNIKYYPSKGFPLKFFPATHKPTFRPPLLMIQFVNPEENIDLNVRCQLYAPGEEYESSFHVDFILHIIKNINISSSDQL